MRTLAVALALLASSNAHAIVIRHDVPPVEYRTTAADYPSVVDLGVATATLIAPQWIATAAHAAPVIPGGMQLSIQGGRYTVSHVIVHPEYAASGLSHGEQARAHDIALLRLERPVAKAKTTPIYRADDENRRTVWFVGSGYIGDGVTGVVGPGEGIRRAENRIESTDESWISFIFDSPKDGALALEGISGPGDSGGPAFIETEDGLRLAGISSHQRGDGDQEGVYGVSEYYTRGSTHAEWINAVMASTGGALDDMALTLKVFESVPSTPAEQRELVGRYGFEDGMELLILACEEGMCYRWSDGKRTTPIFKSTEGDWFAKTVNRQIRIRRDQAGSLVGLTLTDYRGARQAKRMNP